MGPSARACISTRTVGVSPEDCGVLAEGAPPDVDWVCAGVEPEGDWDDVEDGEPLHPAILAVDNANSRQRVRFQFLFINERLLSVNRNCL